MLDSIIIGSGPAGLSAALNLNIYHKDFLWFGSKDLSYKLLKAEKVVNYPGFVEINGEDLAHEFKKHIESQHLFITEKTVSSISKLDDVFYVLADNEVYKTKTVILATGVLISKPLVNEEKLLGRGVSYCATCDGNFFKGKKIAVLSNDIRFEHEVEYLAELASEVIYFPTYETSLTKKNVVINRGIPEKIDGENKVKSLTLRNGETIALDGIFCLRNAIAPSSLFPGLEIEEGHILVNRNMETNMAGVYACGDCTGRPYQFTKAVGEGNVAAHNVISYLAKKK